MGTRLRLLLTDDGQPKALGKRYGAAVPPFFSVPFGAIRAAIWNDPANEGVARELQGLHHVFREHVQRGGQTSREFSTLSTHMLNVMRDVRLPDSFREEVKEKLVNVLCREDWSPEGGGVGWMGDAHELLVPEEDGGGHVGHVGTSNRYMSDRESVRRAIDEAEEEIFEQIMAVYCSKYRLPALGAAAKLGGDLDSVDVAVVVQRIIPAAYAFVVHTRAVGPPDAPGDKLYDPMTIQLVPGLGETLAGNSPGMALTARLARRADAPAPTPTWVPWGDSQTGYGSLGAPADVAVAVERYPSKPEKAVLDWKPVPLEGAGFGQLPLIFRSDSNMEDLLGRSGAGLFESVALQGSRTEVVDYSAEPVINRRGARDKLLARVFEVCRALEEEFGHPLDVEGCVGDEGLLYIVQARPQPL